MPGCDWTWWELLTNQNHARRYVEVCGGTWRYVEGCAEVHGGTQRYWEVHRGGEKNQDFMLIKFLNARM